VTHEPPIPAPLPGPPPEPAPLSMSRGQRVCAAVAAGLLVAGSVLLTLSCCMRPRPVPVVPQLPLAPPAVRAPATVSVVLARQAGPLLVSCPSGGKWYMMLEGAEVQVGSGKGPWRIGIEGDKLAFDGSPAQASMLALRPDGGTFRLGSRSYRGSLLVEARPDGVIVATNTLPPEEYLRSVVGVEMYSNWPLNALMAQAVAARTYLYYTAATKGTLTLLDMAYRGVEGENPDADLAVELTRGIVMTYAGRLFPAYFSSTCGGHTADGAKVFPPPPGAPAPGAPLLGVPCHWCRASPAYQWRVEIPAARIAEALKDRSIASVTSIEPQGTGLDGYAKTVLINGTLQMDANAFRLALGPGELKSTRFTVTREGDRFVFNGRGYGHGVGLCQWGAYGMARDGKDWQEILRYYYVGAVLQDVR